VRGGKSWGDIERAARGVRAASAEVDILVFFVEIG